jgi:hypothetical protein
MNNPYQLKKPQLTSLLSNSLHLNFTPRKKKPIPKLPLSRLKTYSPNYLASTESCQRKNVLSSKLTGREYEEVRKMKKKVRKKRKLKDYLNQRQSSRSVKDRSWEKKVEFEEPSCEVVYDRGSPERGNLTQRVGNEVYIEEN